MLTSQVIFLKLKSGNPRHIKGNHVHGLFFKKILRFANPQLADYLHSSDTPKPFSISYIYQKGQIFWFRIASWDDLIAQAVFDYFKHQFEIRINQCTFELIKTSTDATESPWAARIEMKKQIQLSQSFAKDTFWLEHYSPTSFKCGDAHLPLPVPELIIKSICRNIPAQIKNTIVEPPERLLKKIQLKEHRINSVYNKKNYGAIASFTGKTHWQIAKNASESERNALLTLFHFAFYAGIGVKTTQGMGMCRIRALTWDKKSGF